MKLACSDSSTGSGLFLGHTQISVVSAPLGASTAIFERKIPLKEQLPQLSWLKNASVAFSHLFCSSELMQHLLLRSSTSFTSPKPLH